MLINETSQPLVSCIMPTYNRRQFVPQAIAYFLRQESPRKELVILDDGEDRIGDLVPDHPEIRYFHEPKGRTLGAKRNRLCELARGDIIAHWDDDDWYASHRLDRQVKALKDSGKLLCGIEHLLYYDSQQQAAFEYTCRSEKSRWLSLLCYQRKLWQHNRFPDIQVGSDTRFLWHVPQHQVVVLDNDGLNVCLIHRDNVSPKQTTGHCWRAIDIHQIQAILGNEWEYWHNPEFSISKSNHSKKIKQRPINWTVIIPTYNRPNMLLSLLHDLLREEDNGNHLDVRVYDDASHKKYDDIRKFLKVKGWKYYRANRHHGKHRYWQWVDLAFGQTVTGDQIGMFLFIHDDYRLEDLFFTKVIDAWHSIRDPRKRALTVSVNQARRHTRCWTGVDPVRIDRVWKTQWVDGAFIAESGFFKALRYRVPPVSQSRWVKDPTLSSGVGRNLSVHLVNAGYNLYRTHRNLAHHQDGPSMLHAVEQTVYTVSPQSSKKVKSPAQRSDTNYSSPPKRKKWVVVIMTYERPLRLLDLLNDIQREQTAGHAIDVRVYNDASQEDYAAPISHIRRNQWRYYCAKQNHGKKRFWQWVNHVYSDLKGIDNNTLIAFLQDDVRLCRDFFERAEVHWLSIDDTRKATLTLLLDSQRHGRPCWTGIKPQLKDRVWKTQWVDQLFMADRRFLEAISFHIPSIPSQRWQLNSNMSSGVGQMLSMILHRCGWNMYCVSQSLIAHVENPSVMNGSLREKESMQTVNFIDGNERLKRIVQPGSVVASMAAIPQREESLKNVVSALLPQVDRLKIYLNNYQETPTFLLQNKIEIASSGQYGDLKDIGKFFWSERRNGYQLTCDDDLLYPPNYVAKLLAGVERYKKPTVVGFHGIVLKPKVRSYYRDRTIYHFSQALECDCIVHILGTGCAGWHSNSLNLKVNDFRIPNMADLWLGRICQSNEIPMITIARKKNWLLAQPFTDTIYNHFVGNDEKPTRIVNDQGSWKLQKIMDAPERRQRLSTACLSMIA